MPYLVHGLLFMLMVQAIFPLAADDWPHWRGPDFNGISKEKNWMTPWSKEGPKQLWKANVGIGFSSMTVARGRVFTMGNRDGEDTVYCLDAGTGAVIWKHSYKCVLDPRFYEGGTLSTPTISSDGIFTISKRGDVFCLDTATGKILWQKNIVQELGLALPANDQDNWWGFAGSPLVRGNLLLLNAASDGVALNKRNGKVVWSNGKGLCGYSTPVAFQQNGRDLIALAAADSIVAVGERDGTVLWRFPWKTAYNVNAPDPIISDGRIFISSYRHGCVLLQMKGDGIEKIYENKNINNHLNPCVLINGFLYGIDGDAGYAGGVNCLEFATGALKWSEKGAGTGALMAADGKLIVQGAKGELIIAEAAPEKFKPLARAQVMGGKCWTVPVLANGRIYCRNSVGDLVCLDVRGGAARAK
jgi:outer membrane protein assembly factor BamB